MKKCMEFECYKEFLRHVEESRNLVQRGFRSKLAEGLGVQNAYISKVLNGEAHLSLEQGIRLCQFLHLEDDDRQYLIWLIEYARAGTDELKNFFGQLLAGLREKHLNLKQNVGAVPFLNSETQAVYYSHWYYSAIHAIVSIPGYQAIDEITKALKLNRRVVEDAILFLVRCGILEQAGSELRTGKNQLHLDRSSPNISKLHANWRIRAIASLADGNEQDIHYSTISSLSAKDVEILRTKMVKVVKEYVETVRHSPEEKLYSFCLDFFNVGGF